MFFVTFLLFKKTIHRRRRGRKEEETSLASEMPARDELRYPPGTYLAGGQSFFVQPRLSRD